MSYSELTRRYFDAAPAAGMLTGPKVARGAAGTAAQGTWVQFDVLTSDGSGVIESARFLCFGCPHTIAVAGWVAERAPGRRVDAGLPESVHALRARFDVPVEKLGRLLIVEDAWAAASRQAAALGAALGAAP